MRTRDGRIYTGVNLDAYLGRMAVCAEAVALGRAVTERGETGNIFNAPLRAGDTAWAAFVALGAAQSVNLP